MAFILICLGGAAFCLFCSGEYNVDFPIQSIFWLKGEVISSTISGFAFLWYIAEETGLIKRRYVIICLIWTSLSVLSQFLDLGELTWVTSRPFILRVDLPFGLDFVYKEVDRGIVLIIIDFVGFFILVYLFRIVLKFGHFGNRKKFLILFFSLSFIISAQIIDFFIGIGLFSFIFLLEYAWLATILIMGLNRSNDFIEAALTRKTLEKTDQELKESQATLRTIIDSTSDMIWSVDVDSFSLLTFNKSFQDYFSQQHGITVVAGMCLNDLLSSEEEKLNWNEIYRRGLAEGSYSIEYKNFIHSRTFLLSINLLRHDDRVFGLSVFGQDITDRKDAEEKIAASLKEKEVLLQEVYHRTKNNMSVIISMLRLQSREINDNRLKEAYTISIDRIISMSLVHDKLYNTDDLSHIDLKDYIKDLANRLTATHSLTDHKPSLVFEMDSVYVLIDTAINCGLIANELITNALKYAFPAGRTGEITIRLNQDKEAWISLAISDNGIGMPTGFDIKRDGHLGLRLIQSVAHGKLDARMELNTSHGMLCVLKFKDIGENH